MYKIEGITDLNGKSKDEDLRDIRERHSLYGYLHGEPCIGGRIIFVYDNDNNDSGVCLRSSNINKVEFVEEEGLYIITTRNSIYYIRDIGEIDTLIDGL